MALLQILSLVTLWGVVYKGAVPFCSDLRDGVNCGMPQSVRDGGITITFRWSRSCRQFPGWQICLKKDGNCDALQLEAVRRRASRFNNNNNNNNNNNHDNVIARVRPNQPIWAVSPPNDWLLPSADTIAIYYYYSARKLILILPSHGGWKAEST